MKKCGCTGHRPGSFAFGTNEEHPDCIRIKQELQKGIFLAIKDGYDYFISRMARGTDLWFAEAILDIRDAGAKIKLECFLPGKFQTKYWSKSDKDRYAAILKRCDRIECFSDRPCKPYILLSSDEMMVDKVDRIIAVYDGSGSGGTAHTFSYAYMQRKEIWHIDPIFMTAKFVEY